MAPTATSHSPASSPWRHVAHSLAFPSFIEKLIDQRGVRASAEPANGRADRTEQFELAVDGLELSHVPHSAAPVRTAELTPRVQIYCSGTQMLIDSYSRLTRRLGTTTASLARLIHQHPRFAGIVDSLQRSHEVGQACCHRKPNALRTNRIRHDCR